MAKIRCPKLLCRSTNCTPITEKKKYHAGKGLLGGALGAVTLGPVGAAVGVASGLNGKKKVTFMCNSCGNVFTVKL